MAKMNLHVIWRKWIMKCINLAIESKIK